MMRYNSFKHSESFGTCSSAAEPITTSKKLSSYGSKLRYLCKTEICKIIKCPIFLSLHVAAVELVS
jgi:hypothetical protein